MGYSHLGERGGQGALLVYQHLRYGLGIIGLVCIPLLLVVRLKVPPRTSLVLLLPAICIFVLMLSGSGFMRYALPLAPLLAVLLARLGVLLRARALTACLIVLVAVDPINLSGSTSKATYSFNSPPSILGT